MKGRLRDRPLPLLFHDIGSRGRSGVLTLEKGQVKKQICLLKGIVRFAASNLREDRLAEYLIRAWVLPEETVRGALQSLADGQRIGDFLVRSGAITTADLHSHIRQHVLDLVVPCYEWRDGDYRFQEGVPNMVGEMMSEIPILEFDIERFRRQIQGAQVEKILSENVEGMVLCTLPEAALSRVKLSPPEKLVLDHADGSVSFTEMLKLSPDAEYEIARAFGVLKAAGAVSLGPRKKVEKTGLHDTASARAQTSGGRVSDPSVLPAEVRYYKQMHDLLIDADHYTILQVDRKAPVEEIRHAYYSLAKEVHPDLFLTPSLSVLHEEMEELFTQVREAYGTLIDPDARARYDAELQAGVQAAKPTASEQQILARQNFIRGRILSEEGKLTEAVKFLQNAVDMEPGRADYRRLLASIQAGNPRLRRDAEENYLKAIEIDPARADTYLALALLYQKIGDATRAAEKLRECLKWDPANMEAAEALAEMGRQPGHR